MRLRDVLSIFSKYSAKITLISSSLDGHNKKIDSISHFRIALQMLEKTGAFKQEIEIIKGFSAIFLTTDDIISMPAKECDKLIGLINQLRNKVHTANLVLQAILPPQDLNSLSLKLPKINSLKDLSKISEKLDKIFDQLLVNEFVKGKTSLQNFDTGSEWLEIVFNSTKAAGLVASVVYTVLVLKREDIKNKELLEVVRNRKIANNIYENLSNDLLEQNKKLLEEKVNEIAAEAGAASNDHEYSARVKFCIDELNKLIDKGLKFFPSSKSPSEVENKLPDFSKNTIEEMLPDVKKIPEKTSESSK